MRTLGLVAAVTAVLLAAVAPGAQARQRCSDGTTVFEEGPLRIFARFFDTPDETGYNQPIVTALKPR